MEKLSYNPIICAIDTNDIVQAEYLISEVREHIGMIKLGLEFFSIHGPQGVERVTQKGEIPFFLDLKFHDIPNTLAGAVRSAMRLRPKMMTLHASGGGMMMRAAADVVQEEADKLDVESPIMLGVTVLTSMDQQDLISMGVQHELPKQVESLAELAQKSGMNGVVCSPHEARRLRRVCGDDFTLVTPGVRPANSDQGDQKRIMTPQDALEAGASYLVIGRPITEAADPSHVAEDVKSACVL